MRGVAVAVDEVADEVAGEGRRFGVGGVGGVVTGQVAAVGAYPVAAVGVPAFGVLLRAVLRDAERALVLAVGADRLGDPTDDRHGHHRMRADRPVLGHEVVGALLLRVAQVVPVAAGVGGVVLVVVAGGPVAAPPVHRQPQLRGQPGVGEVEPVDVRADRVLVGGGVHRQRRAGRAGRLRGRARQHRHPDQQQGQHTHQGGRPPAPSGRRMRSARPADRHTLGSGTVALPLGGVVAAGCHRSSPLARGPPLR